MTPADSKVISVIVPCLNEGRIVEAALRRLQNLRQAGHELILIDGGSRDQSVKLAEPLVDRLAITAPGRARQMNEGARLAKGGMLWFLHLDTSIYPGAERMVLEQGNRRRPGWGRFDIRLSSDRPTLKLTAALMNLRSRLTGIATGDQGMFVDAELFRSVGGFPDIPLMEDIEISRRLKRVVRPFCVRQPLTTSSRRWETNGTFKTIFLMWRLRLAYFFGVDPARLAERYRPCSSPNPES